jgi:hypothetical protein
MFGDIAEFCFLRRPFLRIRAIGKQAAHQAALYFPRRLDDLLLRRNRLLDGAEDGRDPPLLLQWRKWHKKILKVWPLQTW